MLIYYYIINKNENKYFLFDMFWPFLIIFCFFQTLIVIFREIEFNGDFLF